jgi:hypothetical protein
MLLKSWQYLKKSWRTTHTRRKRSIASTSPRLISDAKKSSSSYSSSAMWCGSCCCECAGPPEAESADKGRTDAAVEAEEVCVGGGEFHWEVCAPLFVAAANADADA